MQYQIVVAIGFECWFDLSGCCSMQRIRFHRVLPILLEPPRQLPVRSGDVSRVILQYQGMYRTTLILFFVEPRKLSYR